MSDDRDALACSIFLADLSDKLTIDECAPIADEVMSIFSRFEKAQTPTDDEREALELLIAKLREAKYPEGLDAWATGDVAHAILAAGFRRPARTEPTTIQFAARRNGKSQALIDSMLAQANERGIRVEVVYPQTEPTDAQAIAARDELQRHGYARASLFAMRAALRAAFTAGQEANAAQLEAARHEGWKALYEYTGLEMYPDEMRAALKAALTAGQEEQS